MKYVLLYLWNNYCEVVMKTCDNKSVGVVVKNQNGDLLLIERKKYPFGFACPAGHIDDFGSPEAAAHGELNEEVGLTADSLELKVESQRVDNQCRRDGGDHHHWWVFEATTRGELKPSVDETKQVRFFSSDELSELAAKTGLYRAGKIPEADWEKDPGLEPVWYDFLMQLELL